jgi:predicted P-loop ATPase
MPSKNIIPFPPPSAEEHARAETERRRQLDTWADRILQELGLAARLARATSIQELHRITFDPEAPEVALAIREALFPATGERADYFAHLTKGALKRILKNRFNDMKKDREQELRRGSGRQHAGSDWTDDLKLDKDGGVRPILANLILFLRHHPQWRDVLAFASFNVCTVIRRCPPWGDEAPDVPWNDHHESLARVWFQQQEIYPTLGDVGRAVQAAARSNLFHPVREYLDALVWDGTPRLDTWLITYFHAEDTAYVRAIGPRFLISAVARIRDPGCKADYALVLESPQGNVKSEAVRILAVRDAWSTDRLSAVASKDAAQEMAGVWLIEIAEMDALLKASASAKKSFLTRRSDRFRPPYGKHVGRHPRQCVFIGTINPLVGGYLTDPTGARRLWPVACLDMIDCVGLERDRDQLWAEAVVRYKAGEKWHLETPELEALATAEQAARYKADPWTEQIEQWLDEQKINDATIGEVLSGALKIEQRDQSRSAQMRVSNILTAMSFEQYMARKGSKRQRRYRRHQP